MPNKFKFDLALSKFKRGETALAKAIANANKNYFVAAFTKQTWGNKPWAEVKRRMGPGTTGGGSKGTKEWRYPKTTGLSRRKRPIESGKGILRRAVAGSIVSATPRSIKFEVPLKYAEAQNEGDKTRNLVARKFMGWNRETSNLTRKLITAAARKAFEK